VTTGNRHAVMAASRQVFVQANFHRAPGNRPRASLAEGWLCSEEGISAGNKKLRVLVNGVVFYRESGHGSKMVYSDFQKNRRLSRMILVTHNIASYYFI